MFRGAGKRLLTPAAKWSPAPLQQGRGKKSRAETECFLPICGVEILKAPRTNAEKCRVSSFLAAHYFPDDPLLIAAGLNSRNPDASLLQYYLNLMNDDKCYYALVQESRELLGVCLAHATTSTTMYELRVLADRFGKEEARRYLQFLAQVEERNNLYNTYRVKQAWSIDILCVNRLFRRRGIAKLLMIEMKKQVQKAGFTLWRFDTGNVYGAKVARSCVGMKSLSSKSLHVYKDPRGVPWLPGELCSPHKNMEVFVGNLKKEQADEGPKEPWCDDYGLAKYRKK